MHMNAHELLLDSEVALRLVGEAVEDELRGLEGDVIQVPRLRLLHREAGECQDNDGHAEAVARAYSEVAEAVLTLRCGRHTLQGSAGAGAGDVPPPPVAEGSGMEQPVPPAQLRAALGLLDEMERRLLCLAQVLAPDAAARVAHGRASALTLTHSL